VATIPRESSELNIEIDKGSTFRYTLDWCSVDSSNVETPIDLTGATAELYIKEQISSMTNLVMLSTATSDIVLGGALGTIEIIISSAISSSFEFNSAVYGLEVTFPNGDVKRVVRGTVTSFDEVVR